VLPRAEAGFILKSIGVEPANADCFAAGCRGGIRCAGPLDLPLADGLAVTEAASTRWPSISVGDRMVQVQEEATFALSMCDWRKWKRKKKPSSKARSRRLAALLGGQLPALPGRKVVLLLKAANIDPCAQPRY